MPWRVALTARASPVQQKLAAWAQLQASRRRAALEEMRGDVARAAAGAASARDVVAGEGAREAAMASARAAAEATGTNVAACVALFCTLLNAISSPSP